MSQYTGLLFSADEYWPIGPFRFPIYKDLVPGEAKGIEALAESNPKAPTPRSNWPKELRKTRRSQSKKLWN